VVVGLALLGARAPALLRCDAKEGAARLNAIRLVFRTHAIQRMFERRISHEEVRQVLEAGQIIERYADDVPYPSRLVLGWAGGRPYEPDPGQWEPGFRRRRRA
jgi:hypothetical protein